MIRNILTLPNDKLRQKSTEVIGFDRSLEQLILDLVKTLENQKDPEGLGLSAPQVRITKRIFVARIRGKVKAFVNPQILKFSKEITNLIEGCLSVPDLYGHILRPAEIDLEACDKQGKKIKGHFRGIPARIIQHEIDHLNGILFIDHVHDQKGKLFKVEKDKKGKEKFVEIALI